MTICELIERLTEQWQEHGNLEVVIESSGDEYAPTGVTHVRRWQDCVLITNPNGPESGTVA